MSESRSRTGNSTARRSVLTAELRSELERALQETVAEGRGVVEVRRRRHPYQTSFALEELDVELDDGTRLQVIFKDLAWAALAGEAQGVKPRFLHDPMREIAVYRRILAPADRGTAAYYGSVADPERGRYWLFIEKMEGRELFQVGELAFWKATARWLADLHSTLFEAGGRYARECRLLRYDGDHCRRWAERARRFARESGRASAALSRLYGLLSRYEESIDRLLGLPISVVHGELYASNVIVAGEPRQPRVCPIDWEVAALGPALIDLAALGTGPWSGSDRDALERAYLSSLSGGLAAQTERAPVAEALNLCRLHLAVQWLGWAPTAWLPPQEHRRDWLQEGLDAAGQLGL
jgi:Ser/Thr protein kinase RdoA (MazF antagonist)